MLATVHAADIQDHDGRVLLKATIFKMFPFLAKFYADSGYHARLFNPAVGVPVSRWCNTI